jgi:spore germination protein
MDIHVVAPGETIYSIAQQYGVPMSQVLADNQPPDPARLVVGETLVIQHPQQTHTVRQQDTLYSIAAQYGLSLRQLLRNNPILRGESRLYPGQTLVISYQQVKRGTLSVNGYAYPFVDRGLLQRTLPFLSDMTPFTYGFNASGNLIPLNDQSLIDAAKQMGVRPLLHLSTLTEGGGFSNELSHIALNDQTVQNNLVAELIDVIRHRGYQGLDVDFEFLSAQDAAPYAQFIARLRELLSPMGYPVIVALAPKTSADQPGLLYEGHNYRLLSEAADFVLLMTYEWGYTYGPPMAVAPLPNVRRVVEYALTEMPPEKIYLGIPNYGYDWPLPYREGSKATSISNQYAVVLAGRHYAAIRFDQRAQAPWFRYVDAQGREHEVWFEDARSIQAKLALIPEYGLYGAGYWNLMRPFPENWVVLNAQYNIREELS